MAEEGVHLADAGILTPVVPVFEPIPGGLVNNSIGDCTPRKQDITRDTSLEGRVNSCQDIVCGKGNLLLKYATMLDSAAKFLPSRNARDTASAISFFSPAMLIGIKLEALSVCKRRLRRQRRHAATDDADVHNLYAHDTAEVLS